VVWLTQYGIAFSADVPAGPDVLKWEQLPPLDDPYGFAGSFVGVSGDALIVAGGANFPYPEPWEDPAAKQKVWHDGIFVLADPEASWKTGFKLPRPLGYGVSVTWRGPDEQDRVICLGGGDADRHYAEVFELRWENGRIEVAELPPMPKPAAFFCGALLGDTIYVAGGKDWPKPYVEKGDGRKLPWSEGDPGEPSQPACMKSFWALDLSEKGDERRWKELPPWPGEPRMQAVAAVQEQDDSFFFLLGGVALDPDKPGDDKRVFLTDGYRYHPKTRKWTPICDLPRPAAAAPSPAMTLGQSHFAIVGGDDGANATRTDELRGRHPGFPADVLCYHTITDTWITAGRFPKDPALGLWPPVTTNTTRWKVGDEEAGYVVPTGEARPRVRTPNVLWARPKTAHQPFRALDYGVLGIYLASLVGMGIYFARREKSTGDFFLGGRRIPWWAAGLSIFGTQLSAITFMSIPAKSFGTDWTFFLGNMMIVAMAPVVVWCYLPFFRRLQVTSAYEYLEKRFNKATRLLGSASFVLFQTGRMGIVLFLPALALSTVTGINVYYCIALMGALATVYTVLGGIEAVIWTDVLQVFVLLGGAGLSLAIMVAHVDGGWGAIWSMAGEAGKLRVADFGWDFTAAVAWVVMLGAAMQTLVSYTSDQTVVQRYLTTADKKAAARSVWTNAVLTIPASLLFFGVGTALWAFYNGHPDMLNPTGKSDYIFPWFIAQQLPPGVAGLVIAGLFAAAMSSLDSSMNSMATAITTDYYRWLKPGASDHHCLKLARWLTAILGLFGTASAALMAYHLGNKSMWDQYMRVVGLFGGGLAGLFALGIFTRRANGFGAVVGFAVSAAVLYYVMTQTAVHFMLFAAVGIFCCFAVGYVVSLATPFARRSVAGLTVYTISDTEEN
jgi:SSS family transporter